MVFDFSNYPGAYILHNTVCRGDKEVKYTLNWDLNTKYFSVFIDLFVSLYFKHFMGKSI